FGAVRAKPCTPSASCSKASTPSAARSANPPLLQRFETSSDATRLLYPDCGSRRPARPPRVARNWNFESSSLQGRVRELSVPASALLFEQLAYHPRPAA